MSTSSLRWRCSLPVFKHLVAWLLQPVLSLMSIFKCPHSYDNKRTNSRTLDKNSLSFSIYSQFPLKKIRISDASSYYKEHPASNNVLKLLWGKEYLITNSNIIFFFWSNSFESSVVSDVRAFEAEEYLGRSGSRKPQGPYHPTDLTQEIYWGEEWVKGHLWAGTRDMGKERDQDRDR